ncbi:RtcB family protein [Candidatus Methylacidiphilum infernorum]|uniref:tRNA-splicing ligase RtcB n=1 Tax=Candidatus Methylacidiphilum infernorum TaxID=511746 RepID=A0ABX7PU85_9BACT|nr:RtcB family protein [Candidatus Methylacidiphilum infernorum]QSR86228.1 RtcB family protein [Candidatus Methylacidiphilum infernorum]
MELAGLEKISDFCWEIPPQGKMRVPVLIYGSEKIVQAMDQKVAEQASNVASLPGIVKASFVMPDAHWGYGFPIGGVAAYDPEEGGVISAGGVGFDISCGVRTLLTGLKEKDIQPIKNKLAELLFKEIPAGVGSHGKIVLDKAEIDKMLEGGAKWAIAKGYGQQKDLDRIEEQGCMPGADPQAVSHLAKERQAKEMGTLGSGNHYAEVQVVGKIFDEALAKIFSIHQGDIVVSIHCGSRGLGHQIGTDYLKEMVVCAQKLKIDLPERELACAPIASELGKRYLGAMRAGINCALANRQIITQLIRNVFSYFFPGIELPILYDVSHNTCKVEKHAVNGHLKELYVHRKGATRAFGPNNPEIPQDFREAGQPVLIGGSMGTHSYILVGTTQSEQLAFSSAVHGAGRAMSRSKALKEWKGKEIIRNLEQKGIIIKAVSERGVAEEAPLAYKDVSDVVEAAHNAGLAKLVARLDPLICIKG